VILITMADNPVFVRVLMERKAVPRSLLTIPAAVAVPGRVFSPQKEEKPLCGRRVLRLLLYVV
jgi:hypothetical protein